MALVTEQGYSIAKAAQAVDTSKNNPRCWKKALEHEGGGERLNADERPVFTLEQIAHARELIDQESRTVKQVAALLGVHRSPLYRALECSEGVD